MTDSFYRSFEDKHRGSRELIKSRLQVYLPFVSLLLKSTNESNNSALDLGCGRGEWLELLTEQGLTAHGIDIDDGMLEDCHQRELSAENSDAISYLQSMESESIAVISGFHIAEHIPFEKLQKLVEQSLRVLKPGGLLILETPNPENIVVGTTSFYLDPTHVRPLPPLLLSFIAEYSGFKRVKILRLQEPKGLLESGDITIRDVLSSVSPDYSIIAQKDTSKKTLASFDKVFSKEYGISLDAIADSYSEKIESLIQHTEHLQEKAEQTNLIIQNHQVQKESLEEQIKSIIRHTQHLQENLEEQIKSIIRHTQHLQEKAEQTNDELKSAQKDIEYIEQELQNIKRSSVSYKIKQLIRLIPVTLGFYKRNGLKVTTLHITKKVFLILVKWFIVKPLVIINQYPTPKKWLITKPLSLINQYPKLKKWLENITQLEGDSLQNTPPLDTDNRQSNNSFPCNIASPRAYQIWQDLNNNPNEQPAQEL